MATAGYGLSSGGFDVYGDQDLFKVKKPGATAPQSPGITDLLRQRMAVPGGPTPTAAPNPQALVQAQVEAKPEAAAEGLAAVAGAPGVDTSPDASFTGAGPGMLRPNLGNRNPPPDDGGLRALQRRVY